MRRFTRRHVDIETTPLCACYRARLAGQLTPPSTGTRPCEPRAEGAMHSETRLMAPVPRHRHEGAYPCRTSRERPAARTPAQHGGTRRWQRWRRGGREQVGYRKKLSRIAATTGSAGTWCCPSTMCSVACGRTPASFALVDAAHGGLAAPAVASTGASIRFSRATGTCPLLVSLRSWESVWASACLCAQPGLLLIDSMIGGGVPVTVSHCSGAWSRCPAATSWSRRRPNAGPG